MYTKHNVRKQESLVQSLNGPVLTVPAVNRIKEGRMVIDPALAGEILRTMKFSLPDKKGQRKIVGHHVALFVDILRRKKWMEGSQITFCRLPDGPLIQVNGSHRLTAVFEAGIAAEFQVLIIDVQTFAEVGEVYARFDTVQRVRTTNDILNAAIIKDAEGLTNAQRNAVYKATALLMNSLEKVNYQTDPIVARSHDARVAAARQWWPVARQYFAAVDKPAREISPYLTAPGTVAVALMTFRYQPLKAAPFWSAVAKNDGLRKGDPRAALVSDFMTRTFNSGDERQRVVVPAKAWNAFFAGRTLSHIKVTSTEKLVVLGTPIDGRG